MSLRKILSTIIDIVSKNPIETLLILIAASLRLYRFEEFVTFLGDQGRDAIIVKRILTLEHLPSIGAPTSIGQIYLGPFYYYFIAPFLWLFRFHPVGMAYGVVLISILGLIISCIIIRKTVGKTAGLIFLTLASFSFVNIELSRYSWNPNLLALFSFYTLFFFHEFLKTKRKLWAFLFGTFFSFSIQLHYLAGFLILPMSILYIINNFKKHTRPFPLFKEVLPSIVAFFLFSSPLLVFDLRHQFLNTKNFIKLFTGKELATSAPFIDRFIETNRSFFSHIMQLELSQFVAIFFLAGVIAGSVYFHKKIKNNSFVFLHFLNVIFFLLLFSILNSPRYPHYFGTIYYSFFIVAAFVLSSINKRPFYLGILLTILILYIFFNSQKYYYFLSPANNQIQVAEKIALSIIPNITQLPYQVVALPATETGAHVRYFLEINRQTPLPEDSTLQGEELFILCFAKICPILGNPQWQIASFQNAKIVNTWTSENISIYKLVHAK